MKKIKQSNRIENELEGVGGVHIKSLVRVSEPSSECRGASHIQI